MNLKSFQGFCTHLNTFLKENFKYNYLVWIIRKWKRKRNWNLQKKGWGRGSELWIKQSGTVCFSFFFLMCSLITRQSIHPPKYLLSNYMLSWSPPSSWARRWDLPDPGIEPVSLRSPAFPPSSWWKLDSRVNFKSYFSFKKYVYFA